MDNVLVLLILIVCVSGTFVATNIDRYKNWESQDNFMKFLLIYLGFSFVFISLVLIIILVFSS